MSIHVTISSAETVNNGTLEIDEPRAVQIMAAAGAPSTIKAFSGEVWTIVAEVDLFIEFGQTPTGSGPLRRRMKAGDIRQWMCGRTNNAVAFALS